MALNVATLNDDTGEVFAVAKIDARDITIPSGGTIPTKQIKEFDLDDIVDGTEDILIQDNGITKRVKISQLNGLENYYTKEEIDEKTFGGGGSLDLPILADEVTFKADMTTVNSIGGISAGTDLNNMSVQQVLTKLLFPYVAPNVSASLTYTPSGSIFEYGKSVSIQNIIGNVIKKSENIINIKFLDGNEILQEITVGLDASSYKFIFQTPIIITSNMSNSRFRFSVTDASNKTYYANTSSITFYYPYYIGVIEENDILTNELITGLTKKVEGKGTKSNNYTTNNQRMVIAYPKSYGNLSKILDANSFDVTGTFTKNELAITGLDGTEQDYYVYVNNASTMTNFKMTFYY